MSATLLDTGPPGLACGPWLSGKSQGTGCKIASYRGERLSGAYLPISPKASQNAKEGSCQR